MLSTAPLSAAVWAGGRSIADPRFSPDGATIAFVAGYTDGAQLVAVPSAGGAEQWLACQPAIKRVSSSGGGVHDWLADGTGIVYLGVDGCVHLLDLSVMRCRALTRGNESLSGLTSSPSGAEVAYVVDTRDVVIASTTGDDRWPRRVSSGADFAVDPAWSPDGQWLAWHEWNDPKMPWDASRIAVRRSDGSGAVVVAAGSDTVGVQQPRFSPDGTKLAFVSDRNGWLNLWTVDVPAFDNERVIVNEEFEHSTPTWGAGQRTYCWLDASELAYCRNDKGSGVLVATSTDGKHQRELGIATFTGLSGRTGGLAGMATDAVNPTTLSVVDVASGNSRVLARSALAGVESAGVAPDHVEWKSEDGTTIPGRLYRSPSVDSGRKPPLLVWIHGGPTGQSPVTAYARFGYFLDRGWSVLVPDYRGTTGWGRDFMKALDGQWGERDVADVASGIRAASAEGWGDADKMVVYGGSAGGFTALLILARHPELCAGGIAVYPVTDLLDFGAATWRFEAHYLETLIGELPAAYNEYVERSPITHASRISAPLLVLHGDGDIVVPVAQSTALVEAVRRAGGTVEHHIYEGEGHSWRRATTIADELERVHSFLQRNILHLGAPTEETS